MDWAFAEDTRRSVAVLDSSKVIFLSRKDPASITFTDSSVDPGNKSIFTFLTQAVGTAASNRYIAVIVTSRVSTDTLDSVTVGGAATTLVLNVQGGAQACAGIAITNAPFTSGTTATVEVTFSTGTTACGIGVYAIYGIESTTPTDTASTTANNSAQSLDILDGGVAIGGMCQGSATATCTITNLTEDYDEAVEAGSSSQAGGSTTSTFNQTLSITFNNSVGTPCAAVMASFR